MSESQVELDTQSAKVIIDSVIKIDNKTSNTHCIAFKNYTVLSSDNLEDIEDIDISDINIPIIYTTIINTGVTRPAIGRLYIFIREHLAGAKFQIRNYIMDSTETLSERGTRQSRYILCF